jgi:hypothetical protein
LVHVRPYAPNFEVPPHYKRIERKAVRFLTCKTNNLAFQTLPSSATSFLKLSLYQFSEKVYSINGN